MLNLHFNKIYKKKKKKKKKKIKNVMPTGRNCKAYMDSKSTVLSTRLITFIIIL